jgi:PhnB protein
MELEPYIFFNGNCEEALNYYKKIFGGEVTSISRWKDAPPEMGISEDGLGDRIMHANFKSPSLNLMGADARPTTQYGDGRISLSLSTTDEGEARRVFDKLAEGGNVEMPLEKQFWGGLFSMLTDKYGVDWMINCMPAQQ